VIISDGLRANGNDEVSLIIFVILLLVIALHCFGFKENVSSLADSFSKNK